MADATTARSPQESTAAKQLPTTVLKAKASTTYYAGTMQTADSNGRATNPTSTSQIVAGVVTRGVDNSTGANDAKDVELRTGPHRFALHGTHPPTVADLFKMVYASDNQTISNDATDGSVAGLLLDVTSTDCGVWVGPPATNAAPDAVITADAITDNTTGSASTTLAAGVGVYNLTLPAPANLSTLSTGGVDVATGIVLGHKFKILQWEFITTVAGTGSGASLVFNLEIGTTDVGTVPSTCTVTLAGTSDIGERTAATAVSGANTGTATDAISLEVAGGGTAFTAGSGYFLVEVQNMDTADAIASIAAEYNELLTNLTA